MLKHTDNLRILTDYRAMLDAAIENGDTKRAALAVATMKQALHEITFDVDPRHETCADLTHDNGVYVPPALHA